MDQYLQQMELFTTHLLAVWFPSLVIPLIVTEFLSGLHNFTLKELDMLLYALIYALSHLL